MTKTVKRSWIRKDGTKATKVYTYNDYKPNKSRRSKTLVYKNGKVNKTVYNDFADSISNSNISQASKLRLLLELEQEVKSAHDNKRKLTISGFKGKREYTSGSRVDKGDAKRRMFFINAGYSIEEAADELGVDETVLLDPDNWDGDVVTINGKKYTVSFTYTGSMFHEV